MKSIDSQLLGYLFRSHEPVKRSSIDEWLRGEGFEGDRKTITRSLARLIASGAVQRSGASVSSSYSAVKNGMDMSNMRYSDISTKLLSTVSRHISDKKTVGYNQSFLDDYQPNESRYLPEHYRVQMHEMGRISGETPPSGTYQRDLLERLIIDLSWASSSLEGNRYSRIDTRELILHKKIAEGATAQETAMILNHKAAIEMLVGDEGASMTPYFFRSFHAVLSEDLMSDPASCGRLRRRPVEISGSSFIPLAIPQRIEDNFGLILQKADLIEDPFEASLFLMVHIPYLQPFEDVNKRVSRLGANMPLVKSRLSPLSFIGMPEEAYFKGTQAVYEMNRVDLLAETFFYAYEKSCQRYAAIIQTVPVPDEVKLRFRSNVKQAVHDVIVGSVMDDFSSYIPADTPKDIKERFSAIVSQEIQMLHEGSLARYGLRVSEYEAWVARSKGEDKELSEFPEM